MATPITTPALTTKALDGSGVFDELMAAVNVHLQNEYNAQRIRGTEYADVYLGALQSVLGQSMQFLLEREKSEKETALLEQQALLVTAQTTNAGKEGALIDANAAKVAQDTLLATAQTAQANQETTNLTAQKLLIDAQAAHTAQETVNLVSQELLIDAQKLKTDQETTNLVSQELLIDAQTAGQVQETLKTTEEVALVTQNKANAVIQGTVLTAQECKLRAEFDLLMAQVLKVGAEQGLLDQKKVTETAQTSGTGIGTGSVIAKQIALYTAQTDGFARDAEQKAAKIMADTWNVRRTTDEATEANVDNKLDDANIGAVIAKLKSGINA